MDKTIPTAATILLKFIYQTETSRSAPECYEVIYGHNQNKLPKPLTRMTLHEIQLAQASWSKHFGSSATGAAQFMKATLAGLIDELGLDWDQRLDSDLQDRLAYHLLKRRGYLEFMAGKIDKITFARRLAQEWASFPVLAQTRRGSMTINRGQSYYAGDGLNKALVAPERIEAVLDQVKNYKEPVVAPQPVPTPKPTTPEKQITTSRNGLSLFAAAIILLTSAIAGAWSWLAQMPCNTLNLFCGG